MAFSLVNYSVLGDLLQSKGNWVTVLTDVLKTWVNVLEHGVIICEFCCTGKLWRTENLLINKNNRNKLK